MSKLRHQGLHSLEVLISGRLDFETTHVGSWAWALNITEPSSQIGPRYPSWKFSQSYLFQNSPAPVPRMSPDNWPSSLVPTVGGQPTAHLGLRDRSGGPPGLSPPHLQGQGNLWEGCCNRMGGRMTCFGDKPLALRDNSFHLLCFCPAEKSWDV